MIEEHPAAVPAARDDRRFDPQRVRDPVGVGRRTVRSPSPQPRGWGSSRRSPRPRGAHRTCPPSADRLTTACTCSSAAIAIESDAPKDPPTSTTEVAPLRRAYATTADRSSSRACARASYAMARHPRSAKTPARPKKSSLVPVAPCESTATSAPSPTSIALSSSPPLVGMRTWRDPTGGSGWLAPQHASASETDNATTVSVRSESRSGVRTTPSMGPAAGQEPIATGCARTRHQPVTRREPPYQARRSSYCTT